MTSQGEVVLQATDISKSFPGVKALDGVSLTLRSGKLTALLGENGAGKSTLMNIIAGVFPPDAGTMQMAGQTIQFSNPREALDAGIAMIFQELNLVPNLTVAQNIFLGREPLTAFGLIDTAKMNTNAALLLAELDLAVEPTTPLGQLRVGQQQIIEIAKAISCNAQILIMDEPTSAITEHEIAVLFTLIDKLKQQGVAIAYITHKLEELARIGDDAIVMRDGKLISAAPLKDLNRNDIVEMMVGRTVQKNIQRRPPNVGTQALRVECLTLKHPNRPGDYLIKDISFKANRGEVLGIFGLMGAGRTELLETIFGLHPKSSNGRYYIDGKPVKISSPTDAIACGLALAPEDRKHEGLVLGLSVTENASLACLERFERFGFLNSAPELAMVEETIARFRVKTPSPHELIRNLSGGNQQKVILGKWLANNPTILLLDEPTRGIDIKAKEEIYSMIHGLSNSGLAVVVVSSELPEILSLSDRLMVMCEGRKTAEFTRAEANEHNIMKAALPKMVVSA
jgi:ribose transport system ATP-binding protein